MAAIYCLNLLGAQALIRVYLLDFVLARNQQGANLQIGGRLPPPHLGDGLLPVLGKVPQESRKSPPRSARYASRAVVREVCLNPFPRMSWLACRAGS